MNENKIRAAAHEICEFALLFGGNCVQSGILKDCIELVQTNDEEDFFESFIDAVEEQIAGSDYAEILISASEVGSITVLLTYRPEGTIYYQFETGDCVERYEIQLP